MQEESLPLSAPSPHSQHEAPEQALPSSTFYSIEYPGYIQDGSTLRAINSLGGRQKIDHAFRRPPPRTEALLELNFRPGNPFVHPIPGNVIGVNNIVLKVTKRRRRDQRSGEVGEYTAEAVGCIAKTARFRSMADYQYLPDLNDPISRLRSAMNEMDVEALCSYTIPDENVECPGQPPGSATLEPNLDPLLLDISANAAQTAQIMGGEQRHLRLFPPPLFGRQAIPQGYNFKQNTASMVSTTVDEETGEEKKRMINRMRWKGYGPASITFSDINVPTKPPESVEAGRSQINEQLLEKLLALFKERPIWTRMSLFNQFSAAEARDIVNSKLLLPLCCYVFQDGPWRDTLVQFSYDPRRNPKSRLFQRLYFRNANHPIARPSVTSRRQERSNLSDQFRAHDESRERRTSHIFDGKTLTKETAAFQLCDITDPMLKKMIEDPSGLREVCNERDGWYSTEAFERIKTVLRHKFFSLLEGHPATDEESQALLVSSEGSVKMAITQRSQKQRVGKHNMAKGALRPEDAAAMRLRATLDRNIKSLKNRG